MILQIKYLNVEEPIPICDSIYELFNLFFKHYNNILHQEIYPRNIRNINLL